MTDPGMTDPGMTDPGMTGLLGGLLAGYRPSTVQEEVDLTRVRALVDSATGSAAGGDADPWRRSLPLHVTASAVVVHPPTRRVLLRWHARQGTWLHVGGHGDPGETDPLAVAVRETVEETGLDDVAPWPDAALRHVAVVSVPPSATESAHEHADLRFVLATATPDAARPEHPTAALRWLPVDEAVAATASPSLHETLARVARLLA
jgi:8-oxo-dGTP pyrophosphatase MutT (NUDIX family)